jgi:bacteriocin biosynthesis cyclodehydratase domain-containing protein
MSEAPATRFRLARQATWAPTADGLIASAGTWYGVARGPAAEAVRDRLAAGGDIAATVGTAPVLRTLNERGELRRCEDGDEGPEYRAMLSAETGTPVGELARFAAEGAGVRGVEVQGKDEFCDALAGLVRAEMESAVRASEPVGTSSAGPHRHVPKGAAHPTGSDDWPAATADPAAHRAIPTQFPDSALAPSRPSLPAPLPHITRVPVFEPPPPDHLAVICIATAEDQAALPDLNTRMLEAATPWLLVDARAGTPSLVGPLFVPPDTACLECLRRRRAGLTGHPAEYRTLLADRLAGPPGPWQRHLLLGLAAGIVLGWVLAADPWLPGACFELGVAQGPTVRRHEVLAVPGCPACRGAWRATPAEDGRRFSDA